MKNFILLIVACMLQPYLAYTQPTSIVRISGPKKTIVTSIAKDEAGNIFATGQCNFKTQADVFTSFSSKDSNDAFIVRYTSGGLVSWARTFGTHGKDQGVMLATDKQGNVYCAAYIGDTLKIGKDVFPAGSAQSGVLLKYDKNGNYLWGKNFYAQGDLTWRTLKTDSNGNVHLLAWAKTDTVYVDANKLSLKTSTTKYKIGMFYCKIAPSGLVSSVVVAESFSGAPLISGTVSPGGSFYTICQFDSGLNVIGNQKLTFQYTCHALVKIFDGKINLLSSSKAINRVSVTYDVLYGTNDNIYVNNVYKDSLVWGSFKVKGSSTSQYPSLIRLDTLGNVLKMQNLINQGTLVNSFSIAIDSLSRVYATAAADRPKFSPNIQLTSQSNDFFVAVFDSNFSFIKANAIKRIKRTYHDLICNSIIGYKDKAILAGHSDESFDYGSYSYFPTDSSCNFILTTDSTLYTAAPEQASPSIQTPGISALLYPNPTNGAFTLSYTLPGSGRVRLRIMDIQGRLAYEKDMGVEQEGRHEFKAGEEKHLLPGVYFVQLSSGAEMSVSRLVVIQP